MGFAENLAAREELLHPLQGSLFPDPDISHDQDAQEHAHLQQSKQPQQLELDCPWKQENRLYIEHHEQNGDDIKPDRVAPPRVVKRRYATFVGHQFDGVGFSGPDQREQRQRPCGYEKRNQSKDKNRYVILWHGELPLLSLHAGASLTRSATIPPPERRFNDTRHKLAIDE